MAITTYSTGTISLTNGSAVVTGAGTGWQTALIVGGVIYPEAAGNPLPIASVNSNTSITAATKWTGATGTYAYAIARQDDVNQVLRNAQALSTYLMRLDNDALAAVAGLDPQADRMAYFTGDATAALATITAKARELLDDADASAMLSTLGISAFMKGALDDGSGAALFATMGAQMIGTANTGAYLFPDGTKINFGQGNNVTVFTFASSFVSSVWAHGVSMVNASQATNEAQTANCSVLNNSQLRAEPRYVVNSIVGVATQTYKWWAIGR